MMDWGALFAITIVAMGAAAFTTGHTLADRWRPLWQAVPAALALGIADRFLDFALAGEPPLDPAAYLAHTAYLYAVLWFAFKLTRARRMVTQYPWLYARHGLIGWRDKT
jgi:hypothetical protein